MTRSTERQRVPRSSRQIGLVYPSSATSPVQFAGSTSPRSSSTGRVSAGSTRNGSPPRPPGLARAPRGGGGPRGAHHARGGGGGGRLGLPGAGGRGEAGVQCHPV